MKLTLRENEMIIVTSGIHSKAIAVLQCVDGDIVNRTDAYRNKLAEVM